MERYLVLREVLDAASAVVSSEAMTYDADGRVLTVTQGFLMTPSAGGGGSGLEEVFWHHNDHLGTPQAMTDVNGTKVWEMSQTPFGIATVNEDPDGDSTEVWNRFRFPGQYWDWETQSHYNYFRTYDPYTGRYTQHDPIGLDGGMNPYGYVGGNPVSNFDPEGLVCVTCVAKGPTTHPKTGTNYDKDGTKWCKYKCWEDCKTETFNSAGTGNYCYGQEGGTAWSVLKFKDFEVDTESYWDRFWYDERLIQEINRRFK